MLPEIVSIMPMETLLVQDQCHSPLILFPLVDSSNNNSSNSQCNSNHNKLALTGTDQLMVLPPGISNHSSSSNRPTATISLCQLLLLPLMLTKVILQLSQSSRANMLLKQLPLLNL